MPPPQGSASYKKQNGTLFLSTDRRTVSWTSREVKEANPLVEIAVSDITNLQQTPESNPKVMLKVFAQQKGQPEPAGYIFTFTSPADARAEVNTIKEALTIAIQAHKASLNGEGSAAVGGVAGNGSSAAMAIANAVSGGKGGNEWTDDEKLISDLELQQALMRDDPTLQRTFEESRKLKPASLSNTQFTAQFWASRVHLLRAHAIARGQVRGAYNVFSALKATTDGGDKKLSLSKEHVHLIFTQYPLVLRVYDDVVPKPYGETAFWSRFFQSKLFKKLRGLKIGPEDSTDGVLDQYLDAEEFSGLGPRQRDMQVLRIIDMEGNEENHSQRKGNAPYRELRPQAMDKVPIIRTLNSLSEKLISQVAPSNVDPSQPIGLDEATYERLRLRDLAGDPEQNRIILNVRDQSRFFTNSEDASSGSADRPSVTHVDPVMAIKLVGEDLARAFPQPGVGVIKAGSLDTEAVDDDSDDDDKETTARPAQKATEHIMDLIRQHSTQTEVIPAQSGLAITVYERVTLTQASTTEFLHQFWAAFLSGEASRANEVASLVESLNRAMERIKAVSDEAEKERNDLIRKAKKEALAIQERTGMKRRIDYRGVQGGAAVVNQLLGPTTSAVAKAIASYKKALQEQQTKAGA
jgi:transcription initiation factor TFIIH subunit 1